MKQTVSPKLMGRTVLLGRVKMAQALHMKEPDWAKSLSEVENDPLFNEILEVAYENSRLIRYRPYQRSSLSSQFYEMQDVNVVGSSGESPETLLDKKKHLLEAIRKMGQSDFEQYFLFRTQALTDAQLAASCKISEAEAVQIREFILEMSVNAEFFHPSSLQPHNMVKPTLVGEILPEEGGKYSISYYYPHLARGQYEINTAALKKWQKTRKFTKEDSSRIRKYIGVLELSNMKQGAFWKVVEYLLNAQKDYFDTNDLSKMMPVSLRDVAKALNFAPSTISRVISNKSVMLPWKHEVLISYLMPGQRKVVLSILQKILPNEGDKRTDASLSDEIRNQFGIKVSRRTVTACRHVLLDLAKPKSNPA